MRNDRKNRVTAIGQKLILSPQSPFKKHLDVISTQIQPSENDELSNDIVRPSEMETDDQDDQSDSDHENEDVVADIPLLLVNEGSRKSQQRYTRVVKPLAIPVETLEEEDEEDKEESDNSESSESSLSPDISDIDSNEEDTDYDSSSRRIRQTQRLLCDEAAGDLILYQRSEIKLDPLEVSADINIYYQVNRDRLCIDVRCFYQR